MTSESWGYMALKDVSLGIYDGPHATPGKIDKGSYYLSISSLVKGRLDLSQSEHLSDENYIKWTRRVTPQANDLVFSYETRLGEAALIPSELKCCLGRRMGLIRPDPAKLDPHYLLYYFLSPEFQDLIRARTIAGSTVERILIQEVPSFPILIPTLAEQRAIARILGALDNKIELSRRMNRTLEAMAQALFKSWFVDFDPVTAKAAGLQPHGMNAETAALFPVRFHDSQLGSIPEAWKVGIISDLAQVTSGKRPGARSKIKSAEKSIPLFGSGGIMGYVSEPLYSSPTLVTGRVGTLGQIFRFSKPCWPSDNTLVTNAQIPHYHEFLYFQLLQVDFDSITRGSTQPLVTQSDLQAQKIVIAPETIIEAFHKITDSLLSRIDYNDNENSTLANIRDALLPRLLSGELRLRQAEKVLETIE